MRNELREANKIEKLLCVSWDVDGVFMVMWVFWLRWLLRFSVSRFVSFFFFSCAWTVILYRTKIVIHALFITVYALKNIKNRSHGIIIHLKIILLQYFQFSVSTTINSIQTDPICLKSQNVRPVKWEPTRNKILLFSFFYIYINNPMKNIR